MVTLNMSQQRIAEIDVTCLQCFLNAIWKFKMASGPARGFVGQAWCRAGSQRPAHPRRGPALTQAPYPSEPVPCSVETETETLPSGLVVGAEHRGDLSAEASALGGLRTPGMPAGLLPGPLSPEAPPQGPEGGR